VIIIAGSLRVDPADRDRYLAAVGPITAQARQARGCLDFVQAADPLEPDRIVIFERWESAEDLEWFRGSGDPGDDGAPPVVSADVRRYGISSVGDP